MGGFFRLPPTPHTPLCAVFCPLQGQWPLLPCSCPHFLCGWKSREGALLLLPGSHLRQAQVTGCEEEPMGSGQDEGGDARYLDLTGLLALAQTPTQLPGEFD